MMGISFVVRAASAAAALVLLVGCGGNTPGTTTPSSPTPSGHLVWGRYDPDGVTIMTSAEDGSGPTPLFTGMSVEQPTFSHEGSELAVAVDGKDRVTTGIAVADGTGLRELEIGPSTFSAACVYWSPTDERLACEGWDDGDPSAQGIYTVRASDGGDLQRVTSGGAVPCGWSPDGTQIAYLRPVGGDENKSFLYVVAADGSGTPQRIGADLFSGLTCDWSPVDRTIVTEWDGSLWLVSLDGSRTPISIATPSDGPQLSASRPSFSPDGRSVVFSGDAGDGQTDIYTVHVDGSDLRRITATQQGEEFADWGP
jgi:Tol biopolymer transport system component